MSPWGSTMSALQPKKATLFAQAKTTEASSLLQEPLVSYSYHEMGKATLCSTVSLFVAIAGQLGKGDVAGNSDATPFAGSTQVNMDSMRSVHAGADFTCARYKLGQVTCCGEGEC